MLLLWTHSDDNFVHVKKCVESFRWRSVETKDSAVEAEMDFSVRSAGRTGGEKLPLCCFRCCWFFWVLSDALKSHSHAEISGLDPQETSMRSFSSPSKSLTLVGKPLQLNSTGTSSNLNVTEKNQSLGGEAQEEQVGILCFWKSWGAEKLEPQEFPPGAAEAHKGAVFPCWSAARTRCCYNRLWCLSIKLPPQWSSLKRRRQSKRRLAVGLTSDPGGSVQLQGDCDGGAAAALPLMHAPCPPSISTKYSPSLLRKFTSAAPLAARSFTSSWFQEKNSGSTNSFYCFLNNKLHKKAFSVPPPADTRFEVKQEAAASAFTDYSLHFSIEKN